MTIGLRIKRYIIPKLAYEAWAKSGSVYKAGLYLERVHSMKNERTGKPYSAQAIWNAAGEYIITNLHDARLVYEDVMKANGMFPTDRDWYAFVFPKILRMAPERYEEFMKTHSYLEPHLKEFLDGKK